MIVGVDYKLTSEADGRFSITSGYTLSESKGHGWIRKPRTWLFSFPKVDGFQRRRFGASEVIGLFGGVKNERHFQYSEAAERAIGDVLTTTLCEFADGNRLASDTDIIIFGPAFPKVVGRLASLRLPTEIVVHWVCPNPFPKWIAEGTSEASMLPRYSSAPAEAWEDEPLVVGREYPTGETTPPLIVQQLCTSGGPRDWRLPGYGWAKDLLDGALLPREIFASVQQINEHLAQPYNESSVESIRHNHNRSEPEYKEATQQRKGFGPPGWEIEWK